MALRYGRKLQNGDDLLINGFNLAALRASAEGLMTDGRCDDYSSGGRRACS